MSRCRSYQKRSEETSAMLKVAKQTTTKQEEEQVNEKFGTINNNNNNNNSQNKQTKNATHTTLTLIQQKKKSNENNNNNFVKNFVDEKNVKMQTNDEAHKKQTPTQQQKQKQEKEQKEQKDKLEVVKKYQKSVQKELEKFDLINMKTTNDLIKTTSIGAAAAGATKTTMMMPTPTLTSTSSSSSSSSSSSFLTATCDSSSNNKKSVSVLGNNNNNNNNNNTNHMDNCVGSSISVSGSSNNNNKSEIINSNHNNNNNNNNRNTNNSIKFIESNGILQIKIEECDENVQIKTETTEIETNSSSSGECSGSSSSSGSGSSISMQLTTAMNDDNNHQNNQQKQQQNQNDNEIINKSSKHNHNNNKNVVTEKQQQQPQQQHLQQQQEQNDPNDLIFARPKPVPLTVVNPHIICNLCYGYLIDATTIVECLHSFCHSCLIKHLRTEQYCPRCEMMINTAKPNIKPDTTLQAIVYKLVPGLYEKEFLRRRAFYKNHPEEAALATPEQRGDDTEHLIFSPTEYMSISLEYADIDEHLGSNTADEYSELLHPRYIQCPAKFTVGLLKKFVYSKFSIDIQRFSIDIMYKVKTIVLLDHYTVMDVAYIYTWKRDAPMRFYFRVKESFKPLIKQENLQQTNSSNTTSYDQRMMTVIHTPITTPNSSPSKNSNIRNNNNATTKLLPLTEIKIEEEIDSSMPRTPTIEKRFEIVSPRSASGDKKSNGTNGEADNLKITIVSKPIKDTESGVTSNTSTSSSFSSSTKTPKQSKEKRMNFLTSSTPTAAAASEDSSPKDERKIENIKLKIDLSKQNSVTIINMSDPERKEIVKPVNNRSIEKEWKVKNKKEPTNGFKSQANGKAATTNLTVPPLTLNRTSLNSTTTTTTAKLSPKGGTSPTNIIPTTVEQFNLNEKEDPKSEFLKSFALAPINSMKNTSVESPKKQATTTLQTSSSTKSSSSQKPQQQHQKSPPKSKVNTNNSNLNFVFKTPAAKPLSMPLLPKILPLVQASKRKSKEPMKTTTKKPKLLPLMTTTPTATPTQTPQATAAKDFELKEKDDFKIKLPTKDNSLSEKKSAISTTVTVNGKPSVEQQLMPPPSSLPSMRPPSSIASKKACKSNNNAVSKIPTSNGGIMPHPTLPGVQVAAPGNRTPIAKRYQPILPKTTRPNPFADLPSAVNQILKDNGTEIKSISSEKTTNLNSSKVLSGNHQAKLMGPPPLPKQKTQQPLKTPTSASSSSAGGGSGSTSTSSSSSIAQNSYLNYALFNASKSKGNEVPPGCRTPMYSPNSPIYSPSSPQYAPNYNIPTVPQYKYTPKPSSAVGAASTANSSESILQSILGGNSNAMASLFPSPPTKQQKAGESINKKTAANSKKTDSPQQQQQNSQKRAYPFARSPSPSTSISSNSSPTREDPPEKQLKVKSLLNSCNINIPSSLSITITRDDGESASNNVTYPKHKSPVNNYIEILKLPDPATSTSTTAATTTISSETTTALKNFRPHNNNSNNNNNSGQRTTPPPPLPTATPTSLSAGKTTTTTISMPQLKKAPPPPNVTMRTYEITRQNQIKPPNSSPTTSTATTTTKMSTPKTSPAGEANLELKSTPNQKQNQIQQIEKKFTSPEKRNAATAGFNQTSTSPSTSTSTSTNDSNKSPPKSLNTNVDGTKKFRPILPRQDAQAISEILPKVNSPSGIIGTYVSPSGATVNVHGNNKKVTTTAPKKSPSSMQINKQQQQKATQQNCTQQQQLMHNAFKSGAPRTIASSRYSPSTNSNSGNKQQQKQQQQQHNNNALLNSMQTATKKTTTTTPPTTSSPKGFYSSNKMMSNLPTSMQQAQPPPQQQSSPKVSSTTAATTANVSLSSSTSPQNAVANAAAAAAAQLALMSSASASAAAQQSNAAAAAAAAQPDFTKLLKENLLRAQVQAAAASAAAANPAANMLYSYANIAAAQQMYNATTAPLYSYQHAYIVEQISRMQRANNEALLGEYLQKIKAGMDNGNIINNNPIAGQSAINQEPRNNTKSSVNAAAAAPAAGVVNKDAVGNKAQTQANKAK